MVVLLVQGCSFGTRLPIKGPPHTEPRCSSTAVALDVVGAAAAVTATVLAATAASSVDCEPGDPENFPDEGCYIDPTGLYTGIAVASAVGAVIYGTSAAYGIHEVNECHEAQRVWSAEHAASAVAPGGAVAPP